MSEANFGGCGDGAFKMQKVDYNDEQREIMQRVIEVWGKGQQVTKCVEEMGELTQVLCKWLNRHVKGSGFSGGDSALMDKIREEIADVSIMIMQMREIFGDSVFDQLVESKLKRLEGYLPNER